MGILSMGGSWAARGAAIGAISGGTIGALRRRERGGSILGGAVRGAAIGAGVGFGARMVPSLVGSRAVRGAGIGAMAGNAWLGMKGSAKAEGAALRRMGQASMRSIGKLPLGARFSRRMNGISHSWGMKSAMRDMHKAGWFSDGSVIYGRRSGPGARVLG